MKFFLILLFCVVVDAALSFEDCSSVVEDVLVLSDEVLEDDDDGGAGGGGGVVADACVEEEVLVCASVAVASRLIVTFGCVDAALCNRFRHLVEARYVDIFDCINSLFSRAWVVERMVDFNSSGPLMIVVHDG